MATAFKLDRIDLRILAQLQKNGRITNVDLADAVALSPSPCLIRVKRLEKAGYISGYGAHLRLEKLGDTLTVFTEITLNDHHREDFVRFETAIREVDEILAGLVAGTRARERAVGLARQWGEYLAIRGGPPGPGSARGRGVRDRRG